MRRMGTSWGFLLGEFLGIITIESCNIYSESYVSLY